MDQVVGGTDVNNCCDSCEIESEKLSICLTFLDFIKMSQRLRSVRLATRLYKSIVTCHCITKKQYIF